MVTFSLSQIESHLTSMNRCLCEPAEFEDRPCSRHIYTRLSLKPFLRLQRQKALSNKRRDGQKASVDGAIDVGSTSVSYWWKVRESSTTRADRERQVITQKRASLLTEKVCYSWQKWGTSPSGAETRVERKRREEMRYFHWIAPLNQL